MAGRAVLLARRHGCGVLLHQPRGPHGAARPIAGHGGGHAALARERRALRALLSRVVRLRRGWRARQGRYSRCRAQRRARRRAVRVLGRAWHHRAPPRRPRGRHRPRQLLPGRCFLASVPHRRGRRPRRRRGHLMGRPRLRLPLPRLRPRRRLLPGPLELTARCGGRARRCRRRRQLLRAPQRRRDKILR
uniref:CAX7 n=1 Tax=Arundo donax TaxID=35708 RepID=A0A0A9F2Q6_ARUDO